MSKKLPSYKTLVFTETLPVSNTVVTFRPYNVGDERNLIAASSVKDTDPKFYIDNTISVIQGAITNGVSISDLPAIDAKMLLLKQRGKSVGEAIELTYEKEPVNININDLRVDRLRDKDEYKLDIGSGYFLMMKELNFADEVAATSDIKKGMEYEAMYEIIMRSLHSIYSNDDVWVVGTDISLEEARDFVYDIPKEAAKPLYDFLQNAPKIVTDIVVKGKKITVSDKEVDFLGSVSAT